MAILSTAVGTSQTSLYTSSGDTAITTLIFCNTVAYNPAAPASGTGLLTVHLLKQGQGRGSTNMIINAMPIPAGETFTFDTEKVILETGDSVVALSDVTTISATISYMSV
jgi:hypothetical protein